MRRLGFASITVIVLSTIGLAPALAAETYNGYGNGYVTCTVEGSINIEDYEVVGSRDCRGHAEIPIGVTRVSDYAFTGNGLQSVTIPSTVESIGTSAFEYNSISSVILPEGLKTIGNGAFGDNRLTALTIPDSVTDIEDRAFSVNQIASLKIGSGLTYISEQLFYGNNLESITIPNTVTAIGEEAFGMNNLMYASIGSGVTSIGARAFIWNNLSSVRFFGNAPAIDPGNVFEENMGSLWVEVYEGATGWGKTFSGKPVDTLKKARATVKPSITGKALIAKKGTNKLTAKKGTWSGNPTPSISYQWFSCTAAVKSATQTPPRTCKAISKSTKTTLTITKFYKGKYLAVQVTGRAAGTSPTVWFSKSTPRVN
jgi:hypothetical protein